MSEKRNASNQPKTTGHVWDDSLAELTNPPPKWWMMGFHASWILVIVYGIFYPMWPLINSHTTGIMGWTAIKEYKADLQSIETMRAQYEEKLPGMSAKAILADPELSEYVVRSARVLFGDNCAACHGSGGQGNPNYPVLADDDWLFGGSIEAIEQSIAYGRRGMMPAHAGVLSDKVIDDLAQHVVALSGGGEYAAGKQQFMASGCIACHGVDAKGFQMLGGANLTDGIWRFGDGSIESVRHTIKYGVNAPGQPLTRDAVMPAFSRTNGGKLTDTEVKKLAVYVHKLGGGQ
jgi:cytochrome c oxidase cbb3-type subunit III